MQVMNKLRFFRKHWENFSSWMFAYYLETDIRSLDCIYSQCKLGSILRFDYNHWIWIKKNQKQMKIIEWKHHLKYRACRKLDIFQQLNTWTFTLGERASLKSFISDHLKLIANIVTLVARSSFMLEIFSVKYIYMANW